MTSMTRCTVAAFTPGRLFKTLSTVAVPTPARAAMSAMVAVEDMAQSLDRSPEFRHIKK
jgi:hypothetical protein